MRISDASAMDDERPAGGGPVEAPRAAASLGLLLPLALMLPLQLWRCSFGSTWWIDETESALLALGPAAKILDYCSADTNPPGYFLLLKAWMVLGRGLLGQPGTFWLRLPGVAVWTLVVAGLWWAGRRLFGEWIGAALAWAVAVSPFSILFTTARPYGLTAAALMACGLLLWRLLARAERAGSWIWRLYAAAAATALWTHLLSAVVLAVLALLWWVEALRRRAGEPWLLRQWLWAHGAAAAAFLPWLVRVPEQIAARQGEVPNFAPWVTQATVREWPTVFLYHYPLGGSARPSAPLLGLGALTLLAPLALALWGRSGPRRAGPAGDGLARAAAVMLGLPLAYVTLLWGLQRWCGIWVFSGERYTLLTAGFWAIGLALLAARGVARRGWPPALVFLPLAPWLLAGLIGQARELQDARGPAFERKLREMLPPAGSPLFVLPARLAVFRRDVLSPWSVRPIEELPCYLRHAREAWVFDQSFVRQLELPADAAARAAVTRVLARRVKTPRLNHPEEDLYHLRQIDHPRAAALCAEGMRPAARPIPPDAAAVALPESQRLRDGWWWLAADRELDLRRWWRWAEVRADFDRPVSAGDYVLHYRGYCVAHAAEPQRLRVRLAGTPLDVELWHRAGDVALDVPVRLTRKLERPALLLSHPLTSRNTPGLGRYPLARLGSLMRYAWLERRGGRRARLDPWHGD